MVPDTMLMAEPLCHSGDWKGDFPPLTVCPLIVVLDPPAAGFTAVGGRGAVLWSGASMMMHYEDTVQ
jgi:hypothetical protein